MKMEEASALADTDLYEFHVECVVDHQRDPRSEGPKKLKFRAEDDAWLN